MEQKKSKKLRSLVYASLAGGMVASMAATSAFAAHGNASSHITEYNIDWEGSEVQILDTTTTEQPEQTKAN